MLSWKIMASLQRRYFLENKIWQDAHRILSTQHLNWFVSSQQNAQILDLSKIGEDEEANTRTHTHTNTE